jgi:hypothetical protein
MPVQGSDLNALIMTAPLLQAVTQVHEVFKDLADIVVSGFVGDL